MLLKLFLAFTLIPAVEIFLLIRLGGSIGSINTFLLVIFTGFAGAYLARMQGAKTMFQIHESMQKGLMPKEELIDAVIIFVAGIVLLTPGFITDISGILLLFPPTRFHFKQWLRQKLDKNVYGQTVYYNHID
ncbi:FxsA family protein [Desulfobacterales bacterium HSG16]|nr:FxsA family protein [Desulfobacterales bacterium HSG16]